MTGLAESLKNATSATAATSFPEHDLLCVSLEECREVAAVAEVALVVAQ